MGGRAFVMVAVLGAMAVDASADLSRPPGRVVRLDVGASLSDAEGRDLLASRAEEPELSYRGPVGSLVLSGAQHSSPIVALNGLGFLEIGPSECVQRAFPGTTCVGSDWPISSGIGGGLTVGAPR